MTPVDETPGEPLEDAPGAETGRSSEEPAAAADDEGTRPVSAADASSADDEFVTQADHQSEPEAVDTDAPGAGEAPEAEAKPKRKRAPRRRKAAEPVAEEAPAAEAPAAEAPAAEAAAEDDADEDEPAEAEEKPARSATTPARPAPARRRRQPSRDPDLPPPVVRAQAKYVRSSARKARLVCDHIRGKSVDEARAILALTPRAIASDWSKLLESAVANAEHNHELVGEDLYIKSVHADEGPTIKRFRPRARGRATQIRKRTSHLTILLTPKD